MKTPFYSFRWREQFDFLCRYRLRWGIDKFNSSSGNDPLVGDMSASSTSVTNMSDCALKFNTKRWRRWRNWPQQMSQCTLETTQTAVSYTSELNREKESRPESYTFVDKPMTSQSRRCYRALTRVYTRAHHP